MSRVRGGTSSSICGPRNLDGFGLYSVRPCRRPRPFGNTTLPRPSPSSDASNTVEQSAPVRRRQRPWRGGPTSSGSGSPGDVSVGMPRAGNRSRGNNRILRDCSRLRRRRRRNPDRDRGAGLLMGSPWMTVQGARGVMSDDPQRAQGTRRVQPVPARWQARAAVRTLSVDRERRGPAGVLLRRSRWREGIRESARVFMDPRRVPATGSGTCGRADGCTGRRRREWRDGPGTRRTRSTRTTGPPSRTRSGARR